MLKNLAVVQSRGSFKLKFDIHDSEIFSVVFIYLLYLVYSIKYSRFLWVVSERFILNVNELHRCSILSTTNCGTWGLNDA